MTTEDARAFYERQYASSAYAPCVPAQEHPYYGTLRSFVDDYGLRSKRCLEVGCGRGIFQDMVEDYVGTDLCGKLQQYMHKPFVECSATELPFEDDCFDGIWTIAVLEHVADPERALVEMRRVLRPNGVLLLAPAWHTRPWFARGYPVRPYVDLDLPGKLAKLSIPLRDSRLVRYPWILARRLARCLSYGFRWRPVVLRYRNLSPNYDHYWMSDSDAVNSLDPFDVALWFVSRGDTCESHPSILSLLFFRALGLVIRVSKE